MPPRPPLYRHIGALCIDILLMAIPTILVTIALWRGDLLPDGGKSLTELPQEQMYAVIMLIITALGSVVVWPFYNMIFVRFGGTFGKRWMKITVVKTGGLPMTWGASFKREILGKFLLPSLALPILANVGNYIFLILLAFAALNYFFVYRNGQGIADKIAGTWVVCQPREELEKNK